MGCNTVEQKEMDAQVRDPFILSSSLNLLTTILLLDALYCPTLTLRFRQDRMGNSRRSFHLCSRRKPRTTGTAMDKLRVALGGKPSIGALIAVEEQVIADTISKVHFWHRKTQSVVIPDDSHRRQRAHLGQHNTTNITTTQLPTHALRSPS